MASFESAIAVVLEHEGDGHGRAVKGDPGGCTRWGITQATLDRASAIIPGLPPHIADLSRDQAIAVYRHLWWDAAPYADIADDRVATKILDLDVNLGPFSHRLLQKALNCVVHAGLPETPVFGKRTLAAVNAADPVQLLLMLSTLQAEHYRDWIDHNPAERSRFRMGLMSRASYPFHGRALLVA